MTLIAHGILALDKAIKLKKKRRAEMKGESREKIARKRKKYQDAAYRLDKLRDIEERLNGVAAMPLSWLAGKDFDDRDTPTALENAILALPFLSLALFVDVGRNGLLKLIEIHRKRAEKAKEKAKEEQDKRAEESAEAEEEEEIREFEKIIKDSKIVDLRVTDVTKDKSAIVSGFTNETGKVIEVDDDYIIFFYNFNNEPGRVSAGASEASVFFIDPETGVYTQIAKISSKLGVLRLIRAFKAKVDEQKAKKLAHEEARKIQASMLESQGRK